MTASTLREFRWVNPWLITFRVRMAEIPRCSVSRSVTPQPGETGRVLRCQRRLKLLFGRQLVLPAGTDVPQAALGESRILSPHRQ